jgi:hypothetical protein
MTEQTGIPEHGPHISAMRPTEAKWLALQQSLRRTLCALALLGLALLSACGTAGTPTSTTTPRGTPTATSTAGGPTATPTNAPFVCANTPGSGSAYVYVDADHQLYQVSGCAQPIQLTHLDPGTRVMPLAFSPTRRWLMVVTGPLNPSADGPLPLCQQLLDPQTGALTPTSFCGQGGYLDPAKPFTEFIGWQNDATFYEARFTNDKSAESGPVQILRVDTATRTPTTRTTLTWVANEANQDLVGIKLRGDALYYAGYASTTEGGAWLHRYGLVDGRDTKIVPLGGALLGGCMGFGGPCTWTGPWDVSPDGNHIVYHNPGPTRGPSDTYSPPDTPLYLAGSDGSHPTRLFSAQPLAGAISYPSYSPAGAYVARTGGSTPELAQPLAGGALVAVPSDERFVAWGDGGRVLLLYSTTLGPSGSLAYATYTIGSGKMTPLAPTTHDYVWAA